MLKLHTSQATFATGRLTAARRRAPSRVRETSSSRFFNVVEPPTPAAARSGRGVVRAAATFGRGLCFAVLLLLALSRTASATVDVYQIRGTSDFGLYVVNLATGNDTRLITGSYNGGSSATLAQRPNDGMLFYVINASNAEVYTYNPATPAIAPAALPRRTGVAAAFRMAFSPSGTLYYMPDGNTVYSITQTGANAGLAVSAFNVTGITNNTGGDMAFSPDGTTLYIITSERQLWRVAATGGAATAINTNPNGTNEVRFTGISPAPATLGLAFDATGRLLVQTQTPSRLWAINLGNLSTTQVATLSGNSGSGTQPTGDLASANVPDPNLSITKTNNVASVYQGATVNYTVQVTNNGTYIVTGAVADTVPATLTGVVWACVASAGSTCAAASGSGNTINTSATLAAGGTATYTITGTVANTATGTLSNTATVTVPTWLTDSVPGNNTATDTDPINDAANLSLAKTAATTFAVDNVASYRLVVSNAGPRPATGPITVSDTLPAGLTYVPGNNGTGWGCSNVGAAVTCTHAGPLNSGLSLPNLTINVKVEVAAAPNVTNTATVDAATFDPVPANDSSTVTTPVLYIKLDKTHVLNGPYAKSGTEITYTVTFTNLGGALVRDLAVVDIVPLNTDFKIGSAGFTYSLTPTIDYSSVARDPADPPQTPNPFTVYAPSGLPGTYDPQVNWVRWRFIASTIPVGSTGSVKFTVRIR